MATTSVFVKLTAEPGRRDEVLAVLADMLPTVEAEEGTLVYSFHADKGDPEVVWIFELYTDDDALAVHSGSEAMGAMFTALGGLLAEGPMLAMAEPTGSAKGLPA